MYQPRRASTSPRLTRPSRLRTHARAIRHRSARKYRSTAAIVPSWVTAVNAAPGSSQPRKAGTIRRCPVLETGRNSVRPWTMPRTMAWKASMSAATIAAAIWTSSDRVGAQAVGERRQGALAQGLDVGGELGRGGTREHASSREVHERAVHAHHR